MNEYNMAINRLLEKYYLSRMYNMDISIFGYKLNVEILILLGVIYLILVVHTLAGTCNMNRVKEAFEEMAEQMPTTEMPSEQMPTTEMPTTEMPTEEMPTEPEPSAMPINAKNGASKTKGKVTESFVGANINYGQSSPYDLAAQTVVDTSSWNQPDMTVIPGKPLSDGVKQFLARKQQQLPLKEGEMDFFANSEFKPECCPNTYSNSSGCWCGTSQDYNYLITRGGNNVPYSEY
jgi:hypothetical protein